MQSWQDYQQALKKSDLDSQLEQAKQELLAISQSQPIEIDILGRDPRNWEPKIRKSP